MRITKYEHATLVVEKDGRRLIIDPGSFTTQLPDVTAVDAVVITHEHPDHFTAAHLRTILDASPEATLYGPEGVAAAASDFDITVVQPGDEIDAGAFTLRFFGGTHSVIHWTVPIIDNVGVLVDDTLYYPGDSYAVPGGVDVEVLAAPIGAPWLKIGDAMDFVLGVQPRVAFGTHDRTLSPEGLAMHRQRLTWASEQGGGEFVPLKAGEAIDV
ncbi:MBL fold metallo-hydrolase [uncultured Microbacterium sp.]|uniref:MBL fold metallo-hydrolase n=1 Tax=uncultured Microbacterium sp. TaxID=191216 RepID=UPI0025DD60FB|nr:MBL fold metallo-hydrolase [uncultured Microbacterium sp.]